MSVPSSRYKCFQNEVVWSWRSIFFHITNTLPCNTKVPVDFTLALCKENPLPAAMVGFMQSLERISKCTTWWPLWSSVSLLRSVQIECILPRVCTDERHWVSPGLSHLSQVQYPCVLDLYLKMDALLNCYMEITLFIKFVCDKKVVIRVGSLTRL